MERREDHKRLFFLLRIMRLLRIGEWQAVVLQAVLMGLAGACAAWCFLRGGDLIQWCYTGIDSSRVDCFSGLPWQWRMLLPAIGAIPAALVLWYAIRKADKPVPEYMEAFSLGDGRLRRRQGVLRTVSAMLSIGSGACIGRMGALLQVSAVAASSVGRGLHVSAPRLRLMVGCGAAAGMAVAYHTPLAACLFVCEILVGTFSISTMAPLLIASCTAYAAMCLLGQGVALYPHTGHFGGMGEIAICVLLSLVAALVARFWVWILGAFRKLLNGKACWLVPRMVAAGLLVGVVSIWLPEVVGNGQEAIASLMQGQLGLERAALILGVKVLLIAIVFGVGTQGGVLTPSLMAGFFVGGLFGGVLHALGWAGESAAAYAFVGMAAFFAVAGRAPVTALILAVELTMNASLIFPLMIAVAVAYAFSHIVPGRSLYDASTKPVEPTAFDSPMARMHVGDILRRPSAKVLAGDPLDCVLRVLLRHPGGNVPVEDADGRYLGLIRNTKVEHGTGAGCAADLMDPTVPVLEPGMSLPQALELFSHAEPNSLPVVQPGTGRLLGMVSRTELYHTTALMLRKELAESMKYKV